jgi:hypothetical protein
MTKLRLSLGMIATALLVGVSASAQAQSTISCESHEYRYNRCEVYTAGYARLVSQQSKAPCVRGQTWGYDDRGIWVDKGCAGEFEIGGGSRYDPPQSYQERRSYPEPRPRY